MKIRNHYLIWILLVFASCSSKVKTSGEGTPVGFSSFDLLHAVSSGDIDRTTRPDTAVLNLYQGNGRFACSYGPMGLHNNPEKTGLGEYGKTQYMHMQHFARAKFGSDYLLPLAHIFWESEPEKVSGYNQHQSFYDGTITTRFEEGKNKVTVTTWFDPVLRDIAGIKINVDGEAPAVIISPDEKLKVHYNQDLEQKATTSFGSGSWKIQLSCLNASSAIFVKTDAEVKQKGSSLRVQLHQGENTILLSVNKDPQVSVKQSLDQTIDWWHNKWNTSACLSLPEKRAQETWIRSFAYMLYSYNDDPYGAAPPNGLTGICWPFPFPQDLSYINALLLASGNYNVSKAWVEFWAERIEGMKAYTKRFYGVDGVLTPWVFPYGDFKGYHDPLPPNKCYYELHNSGYMARTAFETSVYINDKNWTDKYVVPLIKELALFYRNISKKEADGLWHLFITPSMGQDEEGGEDKKDYLCALTSAEYCFQKAIELNLDDDGFYRQVLKDGLAFSSLKSKSGIYFSNQGSGEQDFGKQKHPVQLNSLTFLPVWKEVPQPVALAYQHRYEITEVSKVFHFSGWTLADFLLASSRIGDVAGWQKDWDNLRKSDYVDPDWIQSYESSELHRHSFYVTNSDLIALSLLNNLVTDWFGKIEIAKCNPWKGEILFRNINSILGVKISGRINGNQADLILEAWKDCEFDLEGKAIKMRKNDIKEIRLDIFRKSLETDVK